MRVFKNVRKAREAIAGIRTHGYRARDERTFAFRFSRSGVEDKYRFDRGCHAIALDAVGSLIIRGRSEMRDVRRETGAVVRLERVAKKCQR
ncbi:hypothetical protein [Burkholderia oklahomensis]|uniref:hypothetical protein n=1 Tax=Burkholderia oklahomensis TaxID=342113 RepID=UPI0011982670|nr:hypothetical protein [Burkholderia oklahomensis]QPS40194.1 hypothetical protein I6G57_30985 [Burkholderia oklahomensis]